MIVSFFKPLIFYIQVDTPGTNGLEKEKDSCFLGDWEKEVQVGYVRERVYPEHFTEPVSYTHLTLPTKA